MSRSIAAAFASFVIALAVGAAATWSLGCAAARGVEPSRSEHAEIVLGMSTALTGPAAALGIDMRAGVETALDEANRAGGIHGRRLRLLALDDGYEPSRTAPNMRRLVERQRVLAVVGNVGTPTAVTALPIAIHGQTLFFGAFSGAGILRKNPPDRYVVNYRASYAEETAAMVDALIDQGGLRPEEIAFFTQRDAYGDAGFTGGLAALRRRGLTDEGAVLHGRYERNTLAVENGLADILAGKIPPRSVIMVGAYAPCARFIQRSREFGLHARFLNVSFVGAQSLAAETGAGGDGVIVTQVVPHLDSALQIVREYRDALRQTYPAAEPGYGSLEGYIATRILLLALSRATGDLDREAVVDALLRLGEFDIGLGQKLRLDDQTHQACHTVWPTILQRGKVIPFDWAELAAPSPQEQP